MGLVLYSVTGLLYSTMRNQLGQKDIDELRSTLRFQQEIATTISERQGRRISGSRSYSSSSLVRTAVATYYQPGR
jgi:hypothetical protein